MKTGLFILAAGSSGRTRRFQHKAILPFKKQPLIVYQIREALNFMEEVNIILGSDAVAIQAICQKELDPAELEAVYYHYFSEWQKGRSFSLAFFAQKALEMSLDWFFLVAIDQPLSCYILKELYQNIENNYDVIVPIANHKKGHPLLLNQGCLLDILQLKENNNKYLSDIINAKRIKAVPLEHPYIHLNLNTPEDFDLN